MTSLQIKLECEKIWRDKPLAYAFNKAGWMLKPKYKYQYMSNVLLYLVKGGRARGKKR